MSKDFVTLLTIKTNGKTSALFIKFQCDLCDAGYVGFTRRHLHQRVKDLLSMYNLTQFVLRFLLAVLFVHFYCPFTPANFMENFYTSYVHIYIFIILFHHSLDNDRSTVETPFSVALKFVDKTLPRSCFNSFVSYLLLQKRI